jgi:hypothetical protein
LSGITESITLSLVAGVGSAASAPGIDEAITLGLVAGVAEAGSAEPEIGDAYGGGYFAGYISHTADGVATHRLIVAPAATGASGGNYPISTSLEWQSSASTTGATSPFDGADNTSKMTNSPAADFCTGLSIGGFNDWYLPARYELEIAYYNLKPTTASNVTSAGTNDYSVPKRSSNYTAGSPGQTLAAAFTSTGSEAFSAVNHLASTESSTSNAWRVRFSDGTQSSGSKTSAIHTRAFRREAI